MGLITKGNDMRYAIPTCAVAALLAAAPVLAADAPAKEESPWTVTSNIALTNAYFFRGLNYTRENPAVQGGFDVTHSSGFYVGTWASNVDSDSIPNSNAEIDLYGGYVRPIGPITADIGVLQFLFPGSKMPSGADFGTGDSVGSSVDTTELYLSLTWQMLNLKYSHAVTDYFGVKNTNNSGYIEGNINYEFLPTWTLNLHAGHQSVKNAGDLSFTDYRFGVTKAFDGGWQVSAAGIAVDENTKGYLTDYGALRNTSGGVAAPYTDLHYQVMVKRVF